MLIVRLLLQIPPVDAIAGVIVGIIILIILALSIKVVPNMSE